MARVFIMGKNGDRGSFDIRIQSWVLHRAWAIDQFQRGFFSDLLRLPIGRRQAAFACLSRIPDHADIEPQIAANLTFGSQAELARHLLSAKAPEIIDTTFGSVPQEFAPALIRCGPTSLADRRHYSRLFQFFAEPGFEKHRRVVLGLGRISSHTVQVIDLLDPLLLDHRFIMQFREVADARKVTEAFHLIRSFSTTTDDEWGRMIEQVAADGGKVVCMIRRWLERADLFPPPPFAGGEMLRPLGTASALIEAGKRFNNCLKTKIHLVLSRRAAYFEHTGEVPAIIEIAPLNADRWGIIGVYGINNGSVSPRTVPTIAAPLIEQGVLHQIVPNVPPGYGSLVEVIGAWDDLAFGEFAA